MATRDVFGRFSSPDWVPSVDEGETQWTAVASSNVAAVGYNAGTKTLSVSFLNGSTYEYYDVPEDEYLALSGAPSVGKYLHAFIKGSYAYERVG